MNRNLPVKWAMHHPVISVDEKVHMKKIIEIFNAEKIHHLPITKSNKLVGIISKEGVNQFLLKHYTKSKEKDSFDLSKTQASEIMSEKPIRIYESQAIDLAVEILLQGTFHILPVVNLDDELVGMVTAADLLKVYYQESS